MASNQAAYLDAAGQKLRIGPAEFPKPAKDEVIVRNHSIAINPLDWTQQEIGLFIQKWPAVIGYDIAGEIVEVGADVRDLVKGDRVIAQGFGIQGQDTKYGGFQLYTAVPSSRTSRIPSSTPYTDAATLPIAFDTSVGALFGPGQTLGLPIPASDAKPSGKTIVLWGASSSVGVVASQLAAAGGSKVIATASPHNFDMCRGNGVSEIFDYSSASVVDDVVNAVRAAGGEFAGVFDTISKPQSYGPALKILEKFGGGSIITTLPGFEDAPKNISVHMVHGEAATLGHSLRKTFLTSALEKGQLRTLPTLTVGNDLESLQSGLDQQKKGVSAKKLVIEL